MMKDAYYLNYLTGKLYRDHCGKVQKMMSNGEWKRSCRFRVADLAHFPFLQIKERKVIGG